MATAKNRSPEVTRQWVIVCINNTSYGIDVHQVQEVSPVPTITPVPGAPVYIAGMINLRGNIVTVLDTRKRFGLLSGDFDSGSKVVILTIAEQVLGILVDSVSGVIRLPAASIKPVPEAGPGKEHKEHEYIRGVYGEGDNQIFQLDTAYFLRRARV